MDELNEKRDPVDDDRVVFVPEDEIRAIESIYDKMNRARQEFRKIRERMNPFGNGKVSCK